MSLGTELLAIDAPQDFTRPVPCPELPAFAGRLFVRKISAKELDVVMASEDETNFRARSAVLFACKEDGGRIWGDHQAEALGAKRGLLFLVERINYHGRLHNGLTTESRELVEKRLRSRGAEWFARLLCRTMPTGYGLDWQRLLAETPAARFAGWRAAYDFEPWGDERADLSRAVGHSIADGHRLKKSPQPCKAYMPCYCEPEEKHPQPGDPEAGRNIWRALVSVWKKALERRKPAARKK